MSTSAPAPRASIALFWAFLLACAAAPLDASAQNVERVREALLHEVMPEADRFDAAEGDPPVKRAWRGDEFLGWVFLTSDMPPEELGYNGPIRALVGMTPDGVLTGMRVTDYRESRMYEWGDFLREPAWVQEQFTGKHVGDAFRAPGDVDAMAQVTITVRAMARGIRNAARRVAFAYAAAAPEPTRALTEAELLGLSWYDMRRLGVTASMRVTGLPIEVSLIHVPTQDFARHLVGNRADNVAQAVERRGGADVIVMWIVEGTSPRLRMQGGWSIEQDGRAYEIPEDANVPIGAPGGGLLVGESSRVGVFLLDDDAVDITRPLTFAFDNDRDGADLDRVAYTSQAALVRLAGERAPAPRVVESRVEPTPEPVAAPEPPPVPVEEVAAAAPEPEAVVTAEPEPAAEQVVRFDPSLLQGAEEDDGLLATASWVRVGWIGLVLVLALLAFFTKSPPLRWVSLATTMVVLGWIDGGFLSISHVTGVIWVGSAAIMRDLPLLIMVVSTGVTLLLWGRLFCGFLCPFGALQDFLDRLVPRRLKRELPPGAHRAALKAKYLVLAVILLPAIAGVQVSLYQYFEPFATVFFLSTNLVLWAIAGSILLAAAVVPRFYCRYMCPLGAALALGSLVSLRRIPRVEQCDHCKVCERRCPTGAIDGSRLDFKECVRCNDCEVQLIRRVGVCRHDMEEIRPRLIQVQMRGHVPHDPPPLIDAR